MVDKKKILHAFESCASDGNFSVIRSGNPIREAGAQGTIPSDNTQIESGAAKPVGQAGDAGAELLTGGTSEKPVEIVVLKPIGQFAAAVAARRRSWIAVSALSWAFASRHSYNAGTPGHPASARTQAIAAPSPGPRIPARALPA